MAVGATLYANLEREYNGYWNGPDHATPTGLSTCRDSGSKTLRPELAAECEAGLDFTPIFDGDVRRCVPIHVNAALVRCAQLLGSLAARFGWHDKANQWQKRASQRAQRINQYCWNESKGSYFQYDYVRDKQLPFYSLNISWPLWAGIASKEQARRVVEHLDLFDWPFGLTFTKADSSPARRDQNDMSRRGGSAAKDLLFFAPRDEVGA
jgi:alpha,alpha-trehalase